MTDKDNIIKPSSLTNGSGSSQNNSSNVFDLSELKKIISEVVRSENKQIICNMSNSKSSTNNSHDQYVNLSGNLNEMDKIPDVVKSLREFSGQPGEFSSWKKSVDRILKIYESLKGTPKYYGILSVIRNKITGNADTALESYNTPLNWDDISKCLTLHYADSRDLGTLEYQMTTLIQKTNSISQFYQEVYYHLSLILNKLSSMELSQESLNVMTTAYRDKALDTFIRGLKGDLPRLLSMREPRDLPEALHLCLKLENVHYRIQHSHGSFRNQTFSTKNKYVPPINKYNIYPQLLHYPQANSPPLFPKQHYNPHTANKNLQLQYNPQNTDTNFKSQGQFHQPKPEPMEIDQSLRTRQANYINRPFMQQQRQTAKRPLSARTPQQPIKSQKIFNTETIGSDPLQQYEQEELSNYNEIAGQAVGDTSEVDQINNIHFLD